MLSLCCCLPVQTRTVVDSAWKWSCIVCHVPLTSSLSSDVIVLTERLLEGTAILFALCLLLLQTFPFRTPQRHTFASPVALYKQKTSIKMKKVQQIKKSCLDALLLDKYSYKGTKFYAYMNEYSCRQTEHGTRGTRVSV